MASSIEGKLNIINPLEGGLVIFEASVGDEYRLRVTAIQDGMPHVIFDGEEDGAVQSAKELGAKRVFTLDFNGKEFFGVREGQWPLDDYSGHNFNADSDWILNHTYYDDRRKFRDNGIEVETHRLERDVELPDAA